MLASFGALCLVTFLLGYGLSLLLFRHKNWKFKGSLIQTKIHLWIPIFLVIMLVAQLNTVVNVAVLILLLGALIHDFVSAHLAKKHLTISLLYLSLVILGVLALAGIVRHSLYLFIATWYVSVVSDVFAYFAGNFFGRHKLPKSINTNKSWEGVAGQFIGALCGFIIFSHFVHILPSWLWLIVGFGSFVGDITNSYIKRINNIKEWSNKLPGHGGYIDRFSSLSFASIAVYVVFLS